MTITLDFRECKTPADVEQVFAQHKEELKIIAPSTIRGLQEATVKTMFCALCKKNPVACPRGLCNGCCKEVCNP